jgi:hypothetical protein
MHVVLLPQFNIEYSIQLANALAEKENVTIFLWENIGKEYLGFLQSSVKVKYFIKPPAKGIMNLNMILSTVNKIKALNPDIVHIQNPYSWFCVGLPFLKGYPIVLTIHDPTPHIGREQVHFRLVTKYFLQHSDAGNSLYLLSSPKKSTRKKVQYYSLEGFRTIKE